MKTKRVVKAQVQPIVRCNYHKLAERIADDLFIEGGTNQKAQRLVLEFKTHTFAGTTGWCKTAVIDRVEIILKSSI